MKEFKDRLREERERLGLSQGELAKRVDSRKGQSFISNFETGNRKGTAYIVELAHALGVDAYWLKTGKSETTKRPLGDYPSSGNDQATCFPVNEPQTKVFQFPNASPLVIELVEIAERMNEAGLNRLIGQAQQLVELHPKIDVKNAAK